MEGMVEEKNDTTNQNLHLLKDKWTMWAHLPDDTNWTINSYKNIITLNSLEQSIQFFNIFPDLLIKNCMLFLMREGIKPIWEDPRNINGGCFSYKINSKNILTCWKNLCCLILGETITEDNICSHINGITISPKKNFCIIKIWLDTCEYTNPEIISELSELPSYGCLFKKHIS